MALSDKNIIITPNIGQAADPKIEFIGADSSTGAQTITLRVYPTSGGMISFEGSSGQLFSLTNSLTGTIYSVTDVSGVPSIEVLDSGLVKLAQYNGNVLIGTGTNLGSRVHISSGTPSGVGSMPSGVVTTQSSSGNNYLLFRNTADNGTYAGLAFQDNNIGGYVIFGNAGGGGDLLYVAGYGGGQLQYGSADSISPGSRTTVASWNSTGLQVNSGDFRTPFIYDSNDTGYYVDPNGSTRLLNVTYNNLYSAYDSNYGFLGNNIYVDTINSGYAGDQLELNYVRGTFVSISHDSMRAPLFYDYNDTGYYVDPAGDTRLVNVYATGWFRNYGAQGIYNQDYGTHFYSNGSAAWAITGSGGNVELQFRSNHQSTMRGYVYANTGGSIGFLDYNGNWRIRGDGANVELYGGTYIDTGYAYIVYDRNDTAYYVDPNGTSNLNVAKAVYFCGNAGNAYGQYKGYDNNNHFIIIRGSVGGTTSSPSLSGAHHTTFVEYAEGNDATGWFFKTSATGNYDIVSRITRSYSYFEASARSPIFYDSDDTGYYLNPAANGGVALRTQGEVRFLANNGDTTHFNYSNGGNQNYIRGTTYFDSGTVYFSDGRLRWTGLAYDWDDTGYYVDPNSNSNMYKVTAYQGAKYQTTDWADGFRNTPTSGRTFHGDLSSGGPQGSWWFYDSMRHSNGAGYWGTQIAYGWEDNANELWQRNISNNNFSSWVRYLNTNNYTGILDGRYLRENVWINEKYFGSDGLIYSNQSRPYIMYDRADTGYYVDPNSYSYVYQLRASGYLASSGNIYTDSNYGYGHVGLYTSTRYQGVFAMGDSYKLPADGATTGSLYGIAWSHPNAGGVAANLNTHGMLVMENGGFLAAVSGSIRCRDDMRAPIYYDSNDTGYYCDPASTNRLNFVNSNNHYIQPGYMLYSDHGSWQGEYNKIQWHSSHLYLQNNGGGYLLILRRGDGGERFYCDYNGNVTASGNITAYSDARLKTNVETIKNPIQLVQRLRGVTFDWISSGEHSYGLIAQEVEEVIPELVMETESGTADGDEHKLVKSVDYSKLVSVLVEAVKEQQTEIDELKALVAQLLAK